MAILKESKGIIELRRDEYDAMDKGTKRIIFLLEKMLQMFYKNHKIGPNVIPVKVYSRKFADAALRSAKAFEPEDIIKECCTSTGDILFLPNGNAIVMFTWDSGHCFARFCGCRLVQLSSHSRDGKTNNMVWCSKAVQFADGTDIGREGYSYEDSLMFETMRTYGVIRLFEKYAKIEIETVPRRGSIHSQSLGEKVKNRMHCDVEIRDCSWFTQICNNEDYTVRGHFRLQACGKGWQDRRLVYINEFTKHGYHRQARIEKA